MFCHLLDQKQSSQANFTKVCWRGELFSPKSAITIALFFTSLKSMHREFNFLHYREDITLTVF